MHRQAEGLLASTHRTQWHLGRASVLHAQNICWGETALAGDALKGNWLAQVSLAHHKDIEQDWSIMRVVPKSHLEVRDGSACSLATINLQYCLRQNWWPSKIHQKY